MKRKKGSCRESGPSQPDAPVALLKETVRERMVNTLSDASWAAIEILDWLAGDDRLPISFSWYRSRWGRVLIADTGKGVCYVGVENGQNGSVSGDFENRFGHFHRMEQATAVQKIARDYLDGSMHEPLTLHLRGTAYQRRIWQRLLKIPYGKVVSYAILAGDKTRSRAAGAANGRNPVFCLVPCHRVVCADGGYDRYAWGKETKTKLLAWEFENSRG